MYKDRTLPLMVVVTMSEWNEIPRFRHQVTRQLMRFFNVLYVVKRLNTKEESVQVINNRLVIYKPYIMFPIHPRLYANDPITHTLANWLFNRKIQLKMNSIGIEPKILINFEPDYYKILKIKSFAAKIYICNDEFPKMLTGFNRNKAKAWYQERLFTYYEKQVITLSDYCLTPHSPLVNRIKRTNKNVQLFLPGHEFIMNVRKKSLRKRKSPIKIGYMGFITYYLLKDWLEEIAKSNDMVLYMIGPIEKFDATIFNKYSNINFIEAKRGNELLSFLCSMDVLIIPNNTENPVVKVLSVPNKFFQYVASGKPVVISDMPHFIDMPSGVVYKAKNAKDFVNKIRLAFYEDSKDKKNLRFKIASENSWNKRGDILFDLITNLINRKEKEEKQI